MVNVFSEIVFPVRESEFDLRYIFLFFILKTIFTIKKSSRMPSSSSLSQLPFPVEIDYVSIVFAYRTRLIIYFYFSFPKLVCETRNLITTRLVLENEHPTLNHSGGADFSKHDTRFDSMHSVSRDNLRNGFLPIIVEPTGSLSVCTVSLAGPYFNYKIRVNSVYFDAGIIKRAYGSHVHVTHERQGCQRELIIILIIIIV